MFIVNPDKTGTHRNTRRGLRNELASQDTEKRASMMLTGGAPEDKAGRGQSEVRSDPGSGDLESKPTIGGGGEG